MPSTFPLPRRWTFLAVISAGLLLIGIDNSILYTALPSLRQDLGATSHQALWIINAYPLVMAGLLPGTGALGDRYGHRRLFTGGLVVFGTASLPAALAPTVTVLIIARTCLAVGAAMMMPATLALIRVTFTDPRERNTAVGVWGATAVLGTVAGPLLGGLLLEWFWWGSVFLINIPIILIALFALPFTAPPNRVNPDRHWDALSSLLALVTLSGSVLAIKLTIGAHPDPAIAFAAALTAVVGAVAFRRRQLALSEPLVDFRIFRQRVFSGGVLAAGSATFLLAGTELLVTQRFQLVSGYSPLQAGGLAAAISISAFPTALAGGILLLRLGFRTLIVGGFATCTTGFTVFLAGHQLGVPAVFIAGLMIVGAGAGATLPVASIAILGGAGPSRAGMASAIEEVSYEFGALLSVAVLGSLQAAFYAARAPSAAGEGVEQALATGSRTVIDAARAAFEHGFNLIMVIVTVLSALGTVGMARIFAGRTADGVKEIRH
ncbi:MFS transporter [Corynebacterium sp. P7003]|uniref:MFS transporter n=1 Tax=Corynebacterium pygosceleis TaxID=2800406 RepID=A0ABT3WT38_9CORY|nr:MFS transporter [Corynebacterium pygosceleis]MCX7445392.1 MFS transporter [Corynebacterium pygosceleis]